MGEAFGFGGSRISLLLSKGLVCCGDDDRLIRRRISDGELAFYRAHAARLLIPLTRHEIRRLLTGLSRQPAAPAAQLHRSRWRRRHQATAQDCHYRRRALMPT